MKFLDRKGMMYAIYCVMIIDSSVKSEETTKFLEVGKDIDGDQFDSNKELVEKDCNDLIETYKDDEFFYDVIMEFIDSKIYSADIKERVSSRFVIWNLLAIAYSDGVYGNDERRLIKHIARMVELSDVVYMELEQHMKTCLEIHNELECLELSNRPYKEIRPIVEQLEVRQNVVLDSVSSLIEDEVYEYEHYGKVEEPKEKSQAIQAIENTTAMISEKTGEVANNVKNTFNEKVAPVATEAGGKIASGIASPFKKLVKTTSNALQKAASNLDNKEDK